jgi:hypothetical protein
VGLWAPAGCLGEALGLGGGPWGGGLGVGGLGVTGGGGGGGGDARLDALVEAAKGAGEALLAGVPGPPRRRHQAPLPPLPPREGVGGDGGRLTAVIAGHTGGVTDDGGVLQHQRGVREGRHGRHDARGKPARAGAAELLGGVRAKGGGSQAGFRCAGRGGGWEGSSISRLADQRMPVRSFQAPGLLDTYGGARRALSRTSEGMCTPSGSPPCWGVPTGVSAPGTNQAEGGVGGSCGGGG